MTAPRNAPSNSPRIAPSNAPVFTTFGCRLNAYETQAMTDLANQAGLSDAVVVNTCAVTGEAVRQARQQIRKLRREHPEARLIVETTIQRRISGNRLDSSNASGNPGFTANSKHADITGSRHMSAAAKLNGVTAHIEHPNFITVLLTKQRNRAVF